jgi:hypothetical protein
MYTRSCLLSFHVLTCLLLLWALQHCKQHQDRHYQPFKTWLWCVSMSVFPSSMKRWIQMAQFLCNLGCWYPPTQIQYSDRSSISSKLPSILSLTFLSQLSCTRYCHLKHSSQMSSAWSVHGQVKRWFHVIIGAHKPSVGEFLNSVHA